MDIAKPGMILPNADPEYEYTAMVKMRLFVFARICSNFISTIGSEEVVITVNKMYVTFFRQESDSFGPAKYICRENTLPNVIIIILKYHRTR